MNDELLIKFLLKESTEDENTAVKTWLAENPENETHYLQFEKIWNASKNLAVKSDIDEDLAWQKFKERTASIKNEAIVRPLHKTVWIKVAAMITLVAGIWFAYNLFSPVTYTELVASNSIRAEILPDGSEITMNKNASLSYADNFKRNRSIRLKRGDVFFSVAPDKSRPFVIEADKVSITVVGTAFNVNHQGGKTEVNVESGIVRVAIANSEVELRKGEKVEIKAGAMELQKQQNIDQVYNYYHSGLIVANNTPISKIREILGDVYGVTINSKDKSIDKLTLNTTLQTKYSLDSNLNVIRETLDLHATRNGNKILLSKLK